MPRLLLETFLERLHAAKAFHRRQCSRLILPDSRRRCGNWPANTPNVLFSEPAYMAETTEGIYFLLSAQSDV